MVKITAIKKNTAGSGTWSGDYSMKRKEGGEEMLKIFEKKTDEILFYAYTPFFNGYDTRGDMLP